VAIGDDFAGDGLESVGVKVTTWSLSADATADVQQKFPDVEQQWRFYGDSLGGMEMAGVRGRAVCGA